MHHGHIGLAQLLAMILILQSKIMIVITENIASFLKPKTQQK